jgi:hypothetical protein
VVAIEKDQVRSSRQRLQQLSSRIEEPAATASVCVVANVASPPSRMAWVLALRGGAAVSAKFVSSEGSLGRLIKYMPATERRLNLWITPRFQESCPHLFQLITRAARSRQSKWNIVNGEAALRQTRQRAIILAAASEKALLNRCSGKKSSLQAMTSAKFLKSIHRVDRSACKLS